MCYDGTAAQPYIEERHVYYPCISFRAVPAFNGNPEARSFQAIDAPSYFIAESNSIRIYDENSHNLERYYTQMSFVPRASRQYPGYYQFLSERLSGHYMVNSRGTTLQIARNDETEAFYRSSLFRYNPVKFMFSPLEPTDTCFDVARISHNQAFGRPEPQSCGLFTLHIPGISHTPGTISLQSVADPDYYIQSFNHGYLRLARISRNRENEYSFFYNESKYNDYYFLSPEQWPYMIFGRENDNLEGRIRYLRPFGNQNNLLNTIFSFEIPDGSNDERPPVKLTETGFLFIIPAVTRRYVLEPVHYNTLHDGNDYCKEKYNMMMAIITNEETVYSIGQEILAIQGESSVPLKQIGTGLRALTAKDKDVTFDRITPTGFYCAVLAPDGKKGYKLVSALCNEERAVLCSDPV